MTKHTPGPWHVAEGNFIVADVVGDDPNSGLIVAEVPCQGGNPADLSLIAAAPDMLAALEEIEAIAESAHAYDDLQCFMDDPETRGDFEDEWKIRNLLRVAIAKARGE